MDVERGAAWRRRQRRLRSWWRHEQQTVAAVLATVTHHSHSKVGTANDAPRSQKKVTSTEVGPAEYFELSSDDGRSTGGERPEVLLEPWPQGKLLRHAGVGYEIVQSLDVLVLQMEEPLPNIVQFFAVQLPVVAEPVIEVPKILPHDVPPRRWCRDTQLVDQLVEVPTPVSYSSPFQRTVDIPVPVGGGRNACLEGFLPEQSSILTFSSSERISERIMEQIVDFPVAGGGLHDFRPGQSSSSVAHSPAAWLNTVDEPFQRVFRTFSPEEKSATDTRHMGARVPRHVSSSTSSAYGLRSWVDDDTGETWTLLTDPALGSWWYSLRTHRSQWHPPWER